MYNTFNYGIFPLMDVLVFRCQDMAVVVMIRLALMMKAKGRILLVVGHRFLYEGWVVAVVAVRVVEAVVVHQVAGVVARHLVSRTRTRVWIVTARSSRGYRLLRRTVGDKRR